MPTFKAWTVLLLAIFARLAMASMSQHLLRPCPILSRPLRCFETPPPLFQEGTDCYSHPQRCGAPGCTEWDPNRLDNEYFECAGGQYFAGCYCEEPDPCLAIGGCE